MNEQEYLGIIETAKPLLDQIRLNICLCNREGTIIYVNPHAARSIKAIGNLLNYKGIKTGFEVVGPPVDKWHHLKAFTEAMEERKGKWGTWHLKGARWRP